MIDLSTSLTNANLPRILVKLLLIFSLTGCAAKVIELDASFPTPLTRKFPITVGIYYPDELRQFQYVEIDDNSGNDQYIIGAGQLQLKLFDTLMPAMFENVVKLDSPTTSDPSIDAIFSPNITEFQLGIPYKTKLNVYEVWIQYNLRMTKADGSYIADWVMPAYGKSPAENFLDNTTVGIQNAAEIAMRDIAASFTLGFTRVPGVNDWLSEILKEQE
jgi:hypothetical protein